MMKLLPDDGIHFRGVFCPTRLGVDLAYGSVLGKGYLNLDVCSKHVPLEGGFDSYLNLQSSLAVFLHNGCNVEWNFNVFSDSVPTQS